MSTIIIGVDDSPRSEDATVFARQLADASGAHVVVANAYPYSEFPHRAANATYREALRDASLELVRRMCARLELPEQRCTVKVTANTSPAHALHAMADADDAALVIVGSTHTGRARRVLPGSTGERLIHGSPCSVAVVPKDYRAHAEPIRRVGVAYNHTPEARAAAFAAAALARGLGAELVLIGVADATAYGAPAMMGGGPSIETLRSDIAQHVQESLDALAAELPADVPTSTRRLAGDPAEQLAHASDELQLLVTGSRAYGPARAVLAGGVSGRVLRSAHCPVIIVPRGVETALGSLFDGAGTAAAS